MDEKQINQNMPSNSPGPETQKFPEPVVGDIPTVQSPQQSQPQTFITGSSVKPKKKKHWIRWTLLVLVVLFIIVIALGAIFGGGLRKTSYDNAKGQKFDLLFYYGSSVKPSEEVFKLKDNTKQEPGGPNYLVGPKDTNGVQVIMFITERTGDSIYKSNSLCDKSQLFATSAQGQKNKVCILSDGHSATMYFYEFDDSGKKYEVVFYSDIDRSKLEVKAASQEEANKKAGELAQQEDLSKHNEDIIKILGSIKLKH